MRNKIIKAGVASVTGAGAFMALGWSFFKLIVRYKKGEKKESKRQWFKFKHMQINSPRNGFEKEYEEGIAWCMAQHMQSCHMLSRDGLSLHAYYLPAKDAKRFVLLSHGYKGSGFGDFGYMAEFLHENGCNLLFIDQRCCGFSEGDYITFGAKEQYDLVDWLKYIEKRNHKKLPVYMYGESMGTAAALMALGHPLPKEVKGVIADCGFSSMKAQLGNMAADWFHLHFIGLLLFRVDIFCRIFAKFRMKDADTTAALLENKRPILFFHGLKDTYVHLRNSEYNYTICKAPKELVIIPDARHICSPYAAKELYRKKVLEFFGKYD